MSSKKKYNLVLVNSFPTNSLILKGAIDYLSNYFNVYSIDLPGFRKNIPPLKKISISAYADFVEKRVEELNLDKYILAGISFGHCVVSHMQVTDKCRVILAMEPYVSDRSLLMGKDKEKQIHIFVWLMLKTGLYKLLWNKAVLRLFFHFKHRDIEDIVLTEIDPRTFFETALLLVSHHHSCWTNKPYILLANKDDDRVCFHTNLVGFKEKCHKLLVVEETVEHFPPDLSVHYYASHINKESIEKVMEWLKDVY